jgi:hypothetical protein
MSQSESFSKSQRIDFIVASLFSIWQEIGKVLEAFKPCKHWKNCKMKQEAAVLRRMVEQQDRTNFVYSMQIATTTQKGSPINLLYQ